MIKYFAAWLVLIFANMPVAFSLGVMAVAWLLVTDPKLLGTVPQRLIGGIDSFPLLAVPFFILAGHLMNTGGVSERIYGFARALVGHFKGGLGHVNVLGSLIFSGMSGSAVADAGGLGILEIKAMREDGYDDAFAGALTAASCIIGPLVPPSIPMVLYGVMANASVGALFLAGIVPGVLTAIVLMLYVAWVSHRRNYRSHAWAGWGHIGIAFRRAFLALVTPLIIMGGIFGGIFTPTEAAGVAALYSLILGMFIYRELHWRDLPRIFREAVNTSAVVGFIVASASLFSWVLAREQVPQQIAAALLAISRDRDVLLLIINLLLLGLGCIMEGIAIMILVVPVLLPIAAEMGIDPVHLGVVVVMNLMIGILTPPFGVGLFVVSKVGNIPFHVLARAILPFLVPLLSVLVIVTWFPQTFMWLPKMVFG